MAEFNEATQGSGPQRPGGSALWVLAALAAAALLCVGGVAVALALILSRNGSAPASIQVNPVINGGAPAALAKPEASRQQAVRSSAEDQAAALWAKSGGLAPTRELQMVRADTAALTMTAFGAPAEPKVYLRVRSVGPSLYDGKHALPMPVRYSPDAYGKVPSVFAVHAPASAAASAAPEVAYNDSGVHQGGWDLRLSAARKTTALDGYRAPAGFQFFTAQVAAVNQAPAAALLDADKLELRDAEGVRYLTNPELNAGIPAAALAPGQSASMTLSFLVPEGTELRSLALLTPQAPVLVPLSKR